MVDHKWKVDETTYKARGTWSLLGPHVSAAVVP